MRTPLLDLFRPGLHWFCRVYFGLTLRGTAFIPASGAVIVAPNHQTYADPPLVTIPVRRPVHYMAWNRLFDIPLLGWLIRRLRAFPVAIDESDFRATREAIRILRGGGAVMIFPEGGRSPDGSVQSFKLGVFRLAVALGVPIMPVTISGGHESWPPGRVFPRRGRITISYHALLYPNPIDPPREAAQKLAEQTRAAIVGGLAAIETGPR